MFMNLFSVTIDPPNFRPDQLMQFSILRVVTILNLKNVKSCKHDVYEFNVC